MSATTDRRAEKQAEQFDQRIGQLREITHSFADLLDSELADRSADITRRATGRLGLGTRHTVVALAGATGSGKSSLFNAVSQHDIASTGVRRPTTSIAEAVTFSSGAEDLIDWLGITRHHLLDDADLNGLVLVDLPDHDSIVDAHREEMERLAEVADVFCWVVDPQKYADAALHHDYLTRFARHGAVTIVALNQVDRLDAGARSACADHLRQLLVDDGLSGVRIVETSTVTGEGVADLRRELMARVSERRAVIARLDADIDWVASDLAVAVGDHQASSLSQQAGTDLAAAFAAAAGVDAVSSAVAAAHRVRSNAAIGWPPTRWVGKLKADPLRRLGLGVPSRGVAADASISRRTSRVGPTPVAQAALTTAVRDAVSAAADPLPRPWRQHLVDRIDHASIVDELDAAIGRTDLHVDPPRWWRAASTLQWVLAATMVLGFAWLLIAGAVVWAGLPKLPVPEWRSVGAPTWMLFGGAAAGILVSIIGGALATVASKRRARQAQRELVDAAHSVSDKMVVDVLNTELARMADLQQRVRAINQRRSA